MCLLASLLLKAAVDCCSDLGSRPSTWPSHTDRRCAWSLCGSLHRFKGSSRADQTPRPASCLTALSVLSTIGRFTKELNGKIQDDLKRDGTHAQTSHLYKTASKQVKMDHATDTIRAAKYSEEKVSEEKPHWVHSEMGHPGASPKGQGPEQTARVAESYATAQRPTQQDHGQ